MIIEGEKKEFQIKTLKIIIINQGKEMNIADHTSQGDMKELVVLLILQDQMILEVIVHLVKVVNIQVFMILCRFLKKSKSIF